MFLWHVKINSFSFSIFPTRSNTCPDCSTAIIEVRRLYLTSDFDPLAQKQHTQQFFGHLLAGLNSLKDQSSPEPAQPHQNLGELYEFLLSEDKGRQNALKELMGDRVSGLTDAFISISDNISTLKQTIAERDKLIATLNSDKKDLSDKLSNISESIKNIDATQENNKENIQTSQTPVRVVRQCRRKKNSV